MMYHDLLINATFMNLFRVFCTTLSKMGCFKTHHPLNYMTLFSHNFLHLKYLPYCFSNREAKLNTQDILKMGSTRPIRITVESLLNDLHSAITQPKLISTPTYLHPSPSPTQYAPKPLPQENKVRYSKIKRPTWYRILIPQARPFWLRRHNNRQTLPFHIWRNDNGNYLKGRSCCRHSRRKLRQPTILR